MQRRLNIGANKVITETSSDHIIGSTTFDD